MPASLLYTPKVRTARITDEDLKDPDKDRDFDDLLRRAADFLKRRPSATHQEGTETRESPHMEGPDSDA